MKKIIAATLITLMATTTAFAHSGGTNAAGCHAGSKPYHCHNKKPSYNKTYKSTYTLVLPNGQRWRGYAWSTCNYYRYLYGGYCVKGRQSFHIVLIPRRAGVEVPVI